MNIILLTKSRYVGYDPHFSLFSKYTHTTLLSRSISNFFQLYSVIVSGLLVCKVGVNSAKYLRSKNRRSLSFINLFDFDALLTQGQLESCGSIPTNATT